MWHYRQIASPKRLQKKNSGQEIRINNTPANETAILLLRDIDKLLLAHLLKMCQAFLLRLLRIRIRSHPQQFLPTIPKKPSPHSLTTTAWRDSEASSRRSRVHFRHHEEVASWLSQGTRGTCSARATTSLRYVEATFPEASSRRGSVSASRGGRVVPRKAYGWTRVISVCLLLARSRSMRSPRSPSGYTPSPRRRAVQGRGGLPVAGRSRRQLFEAQGEQQEQEQEHLEQQQAQQHQQQQHQQQESRSTIRVPLRGIQREGQLQQRLREVAARLTNIVFRGSSLARLLIIRRWEEAEELPRIDIESMRACLQAASKKPSGGRPRNSNTR